MNRLTFRVDSSRSGKETETGLCCRGRDPDCGTSTFTPDRPPAAGFFSSEMQQLEFSQVQLKDVAGRWLHLDDNIVIVISSHNFDPEVVNVCDTALLAVSDFDDVQKAIAKLDT